SRCDRCSCPCLRPGFWVPTSAGRRIRTHPFRGARLAFTEAIVRAGASWSSEPSADRKTAGATWPPSSELLAGFMTLSGDCQYDQETRSAKRSEPSCECSATAPHQAVPPTSCASWVRIASVSTSKSIWWAYSCCTTPQEKRPVSRGAASSQICPCCADGETPLAMWITIGPGTTSQSKLDASSADRTWPCSAGEPPSKT